MQELLLQATAVFQPGEQAPRGEAPHQQCMVEWQPSLAADLGALLRRCTEQLRSSAPTASLPQLVARYPGMGQLLVSLTESKDMCCSSALVDAVSLHLTFAALAKASMQAENAPHAGCSGEDVWLWATDLLKNGMEAEQDMHSRIAWSLLSRLGSSTMELHHEVVHEHRSALDREYGAISTSSPPEIIERKCRDLGMLVRRLTPLCTLFPYGRPDAVPSRTMLCIAGLLDTVTTHAVRLCGEVAPLVDFTRSDGAGDTGYATLSTMSAALLQELTGGRSVYYHLSWNTRIAIWRSNHSVFMRDVATLTGLAMEDESFSLARLLEHSDVSGQPSHIDDVVRCLCEGLVREPLLFVEVTRQLAGVLLHSGNERVAYLMRDLNQMLARAFEDRSNRFPFSRRSLLEYYHRASAELVLLLRLPCSKEGILKVRNHLRTSSTLDSVHWRTMVLFLDWVTYASQLSYPPAAELLQWFRTGKWM